eukprot:1699128-Prymnesium_polylepis.1
MVQCRSPHAAARGWHDACRRRPPAPLWLETAGDPPLWLETAGDGWIRLETAGDGRGCWRRADIGSHNTVIPYTLTGVGVAVNSGR